MSSCKHLEIGIFELSRVHCVINSIYSHSEQLSSQKNQLEKIMDQRINLLTKVANKRKRKADDSTSGDTVNSSEISLACLEAEKSKVKVRRNSHCNYLEIYDLYNAVYDHHT